VFGLLVFFVIWHSPAPARTLPGLTCGIFAIAALLILAMRSRARYFSLAPELRPLLLGLLGAILISNALLSTFLLNLPRLGFYISLALLSISIYLLYRDAVSIPLRAYCIVVAAVHMPFVVEVAWWLAHTTPPFFAKNAAIPHFVNVRHFGYVGFLAAVSGSVLVALSSRLVAASFILTSFALFGIIAMGSRGALLSWIFCVALLTGFSARRWRVAGPAIAALLLTSAGTLILHFSGVLVSPNIFTRLEQSGDLHQFDSGRLQIWADALRWIVRHPLFGKGTEAYVRSGCCNAAFSHPHNLVLQLLMQFGLVGSALLVALLWSAVRLMGGLRRVLTLIFATVDNRALAAILVAYVAFGMIDGLFYREVPMIHFAMFVGLFAAGLHRARASGT